MRIKQWNGLRFLIYLESYPSMTLDYRTDFENVMIYKCNNLILVIIELVIILYKYILITFVTYCNNYIVIIV